MLLVQAVSRTHIYHFEIVRHLTHSSDVPVHAFFPAAADRIVVSPEERKKGI